MDCMRFAYSIALAVAAPVSPVRPLTAAFLPRPAILLILSRQIIDRSPLVNIRGAINIPRISRDKSARVCIRWKLSSNRSPFSRFASENGIICRATIRISDGSERSVPEKPVLHESLLSFDHWLSHTGRRDKQEQEGSERIFGGSPQRVN